MVHFSYMFISIASALFAFLSFSINVQEQWLSYDGSKDKEDTFHIVLISGDEEYRSEESLPMLAKILSKQHGFKCTVL
ncbi:hypothetical protein [Flagellimonas onchidii]|uniref:hypothetical protein n=1 Tax=Flagellimonas onchidii TaxID=2562684 RepID=UPI0010A67D06|nr:hypothetical protein [Allomuricauda onchidii]